jgi:hypothetical protein
VADGGVKVLNAAATRGSALRLSARGVGLFAVHQR